MPHPENHIEAASARAMGADCSPPGRILPRRLIERAWLDVPSRREHQSAGPVLAKRVPAKQVGKPGPAKKTQARGGARAAGTGRSSARQPTRVTAAMVAAHGITPEEYERIRALIGRVPSYTELGVFSAMWNEHCSYKSSKIHLRTLPTQAPWVIQGPGENAGVIDIGEGLAVVFKMESHNHPSYIEPYQGAATGVGGILRDVFTMGARPIACLNALFFGGPSHPKTKHLVSGAVAGIGGYGNSFGVPTVGGSVAFHTRYDGNCLVNAMAVGSPERQIFTPPHQASACQSSILARRPGVTAFMARAWRQPSSARTPRKNDRRQVGDPFAEKLLLEACLEIMAKTASSPSRTWVPPG
jgi:phosphoribosylformylglycinamidine synthase